MIPGRAVRATARLADVAGRVVRGDMRGARDGGARASLLRDRHAHPRHPRGGPRGGPCPTRAARRRAGAARSSAAPRPSAGSTRPSPTALPRLVERVAVIHVTGEDGYAAALTAREALPADRRDRYRPHPFLRDDMLAALAAADLVVGRAGSSTLAEVTALGLPIVVVPYPHAAGHQRANARAARRGRRGSARRRRRLRCRGAARGGGPARRPGRAPRDGRRRACPRPARLPPRPLPTSCSPSRVASRLPDPAAIERRARGRADVTPTTTFDPIAVGTDIQRRIGVKTSRDEPLARFTTMRVGGPADLFATVHNIFELRSLVRFARARELPHLVLGRGSDTVISDRGVRGPRHPGPRRGIEVRGRPLHGRRRRPDGQGRDRDPESRADRPRVRARHPGLRRRRRVGQRRCPRIGRRRRPRQRTRAGRGGRRVDRAGGRARPGLSRQPVQARARGRTGGADPRGDVPARARRPGRHQGAPRRHPPLAPGPPAARPAVGRQRVPQPDRRLGRAGSSTTPASRATGSAARSCPRSTPTSSSTTRRARPPTCAGWPTTSAIGHRRARTASSSCSRSSSSATGRAGRGRRERVASRPCRRSSSSSAAHRPSTTSRSSRARPSPRRWPTRARPSSRSSSTSTARGGGCPTDHRRDDRPPPPTTTRRRSAARARSRSAPRSTGWPPRTRRRSCSSACTARSARTARSRPLLDAAGLAYTGSGVAASALGMDKALFKRMCRGLGLPVVDWREVRAERWAARPRRRRGRDGGVRRGRRRPAADGQAVRPRQLRRDDPRPRAGRARPGARPGLPLRHRRPRRGVPGRRARPRGLGHRQRSGPARDLRPGRDRQRPRVLRLRREVHAGPVRDLDPGRGRRPGARAHPQALARRLPRDRRRGLRPDRLPRRRRADRRVRDQHDPGVHADQPLPDDAGRRAATPSPTCASGSSSSPSSGTHAARPRHLRPSDLPR